MRALLMSVAICALTPAIAAAQDAALLLGTDTYERLDRVPRATDILQAEDGLAALGFTVEALRNGRADPVADAVAGFVESAEGADVIVVALAGQFATDGTRTWFLTAEAQRPGLFTVAASAVSVDSLLQVLARAPGRAVLMLGDDGGANPYDPWLAQGIGALDIPQGVTVVRGDPRAVAAFLTRQMTRPGIDLAPELSRQTDLEAAGFVPATWPLMPSETVDPVIPEVVVTPVDPAAEDALWTGAVAIDTIDAYRNYIARYPNGRYAAEAEKVIAEIIAEPNRDARRAEDALSLTRDLRREIQRNLTILDYNTRGIDGIFGPGTRRAIANWQQVNGYSQTTYVTAEQINRLDAQASRRSAELEAEAERKRLEQARLDRAYWDETGARNDEAGLRAYLARFPDGIFAEVAADRISLIEAANLEAAEAEDRAAWDTAQTANTIAAYQDYLRAFPRGVFKPEAETRIARLTAEAQNEGTQAEAAFEEERLNLNPLTARLVEARLTQLGLDPGPVDGVFDAETRRAIRRYQGARDLPVTGYLNEPTIVRLLADSIGTVGR